MLHSDSRRPGGIITVTVPGAPDGARVEVRDAGGTSVPALKAAGALTEGGEGLRLVNKLAARWGFSREPDGLITWFEVRPDPPS